MSAPSAAIGTGFYTAGDAARLLGIPVRSIRRWLGGYSYKHGAEHVQVPPSGSHSSRQTMTLSSWASGT
jgi:hypothetical protein